ncbi:MAG TPA: hypothetical protein VD794_12580, partial [Flavisolibacter sp.]|nr:hypothetical protein [Flavisolibacter sp.]
KFQVLKDSIEILRTKNREHQGTVAYNWRKTIENFIKAQQHSPKLNDTYTTIYEKDVAAINKGIAAENGTLPEIAFLTLASTAATIDHTQVATMHETASITNFRMPSQSEMIDALAIYIARRFKQEVAITLISELKKTLNKQALLVDLFPQTLVLFNDIASYEMPRFSKMWQHAISEDFIKLPENIAKSTTIEKAFEKAGMPSNTYLMFRDAVTLAGWTIQKNSLPDMVSLFKADTSAIRSPQLKLGLEIAHIINSELFAEPANKQYWISWKQLSAMSQEDFQIFFTLLQRKYKDVFAVLKLKVPSRQDEKNYRVVCEKYKNYFIKLLVTLNNFQTAQQQYLSRLEANPNAVYTGVNFWDFQRDLLSLLLNQEIIALPEKSQQFLQVLNKTIGLYKLMEEKKYAAMVHESVTILNELMPTETTRLKELLVKSWKLEKRKVKDSAEAFLGKIEAMEKQIVKTFNLYDQMKNANKIPEDKFYSTTKALLDSTIQQYKELIKTTAYKRLLTIKDDSILLVTLQRYLTLDSAERYKLLAPQTNNTRFAYITRASAFLTDVMSAGDSKQLANVIEAYSMPPNSYKIKRHSRFSLDLNAYVGAYFGGESISDDEKEETGERKIAGVYGLSVPVGVSLSWGAKKSASYASNSSFFKRNGQHKDLAGNSFSLTLSIIDIAAVVSYRLGHSEDGALPKEVKWA